MFRKKLIWLIGITLVVKCILSFLLELGNDEVYYYTYALQPDWNHFDHPPMVGWLIRIFTFNLHWVNTFSMRLGSMLCAAFTTFIIFESGVLLKNEKAGWIAALLYNLSIYTSIIAGLFVMPDSPQVLFFALSIFMMLSWVIQPRLFTLLDWILLGLFIGLATLSKVHGLFLWAGFGAFILFHQSKTLSQKNIYIAIAVSIICVIPIIYWNFQNDFITYKFHSNRVTHTGLSWESFIQQIVGEFLYQNPLAYIAVVISLLKVKRVKFIAKNALGVTLLLWLSIPLLIIFWALSLFNPTLPHWTGPAYISLFLIAGVYWSSYSRKIIPGIIKGAMAFMGVLLISFLLLVFVFPRQLGSKNVENLGEYNPINDVTGWTFISQHFDSLYVQEQKDSIMSKSAPILVNKWFPGGHILFYTARPLQIKVIGLGAINDLHKFAWLNKDIAPLKLGEDAYYMTPSNLPNDPVKMYGDYFETINTPDTVPYISKGVVLRNFYIYRLKSCKKIPESILKK
ncbi:MAG: phospholipid carrier-dependent glycosyltransferase [Chitinophagaceae bacterium]|nr:MAG: phospholipid carrier-dependent glycosyltransferase [Chitinophagaceae bacterium]